MKVLMSAFSCRPGAGSEPGAGWALATAAAENNDVWLLTRRRDEDFLLAAIRDKPHISLTPVFVDVPRRLQTRAPGGAHLYAHYLSWVFAAGAQAKRLHSDVHFDVSHHVTFAADWLPTPLVAVRTLPLVWGPVGGYAPLPWQLTKWLGGRGVVSELLRTAGTGLLRKGIGEPTARRSALVVANNPEVAARFSSVARQVVVEPHIATDSTDGPDVQSVWGSLARQRGDDNGATALFVGRIVPWKGLALAISAITRPEAHRWSLDVIGAGPDEARVRRLTGRLGVAHRVHFLGQLPREEVLSHMRAADALLQPSMHEAGGFAVAEAVAQGCPVVCLDRGGPAVTVDLPENKVSVTAHADRDLAEALCQLGPRLPPTDRWSGGRLVEHCDRWYQTAVDSAMRS